MVSFCWLGGIREEVGEELMERVSSLRWGGCLLVITFGTQVELKSIPSDDAWDIFSLISFLLFRQGLLNDPDMLRNIMFSNPQMQQVRRLCCRMCLVACGSGFSLQESSISNVLVFRQRSSRFLSNG